MAEIGASDYAIAVQMSFGLFGDGLLDPFVVERARIVREVLPTVRLSINTNGAAYNRDKHAILTEYASIIALHVESLDPEVYDTLMQPLRAERVFPKVEQVLQDFPGKVAVSVPANRLNLGELPAIRRYFLDRGAAYVSFDRLRNRCRENREVFDALALNPKPTRCAGTALTDLIVDCDGQVLICCNDFQRLEPVGNLADETLDSVLGAARRREVTRMLDSGDWASIRTCRNCYADGPINVDEMLADGSLQ